MLIVGEKADAMAVLAGVGERWRVSALVDRYVAAARYWSPTTFARRCGHPRRRRGLPARHPYDDRVAIQLDQTRWLQTIAIHTRSCDQARTIADTVLTAILRT